MTLLRFLKNWTLPISMLSGVAGYFVYVSIPFLASTKPFVNEFIGVIQPVLIFTMLFISFCKVNPLDLQWKTMHVWLMLIQTGVFTLLGFCVFLFPDTEFRVLLEGAMICMITPTATAAAVVTDKLGGSTKMVVSYTILINIVSAIIIPLIFSWINSTPGLTFWPSFLLILRKVFPILIVPLLLAWFVRAYFSKLHQKLTQTKDLAFYLWAVALAIAIAVTVRSIVHSKVNPVYEIGLAFVALFACFIQFALGKKIGSHYNNRISGGQSLGQKNTVFSIWLGATFLDPVTALAGGFYSVWHNVVNSYQLYQKRKQDAA
jgi:bile acid:Na+ symporter, BASS family